jgi:hypothetical protein
MDETLIWDADAIGGRSKPTRDPPPRRTVQRTARAAARVMADEEGCEQRLEPRGFAGRQQNPRGGAGIGTFVRSVL